MKKADVLIDLQFGSTGKGAIAGFLGAYGEYDTVINANMPNAGHTFIDESGQKMVHKVLPNGLVGETVKDVLIGPGSIFSVATLLMELDDLQSYGYDHFTLWIHEHAMVLLENHKEAEQADGILDSIGSTKQGTAAAMIHKIMRNGKRNATAGHIFKNDPFFGPKILSHRDYMGLLLRSKEILVEGAQGYSLGLNAGFYPYCTSRDCTPARFMADCGVPLPYLRRVIGTCRTFPIRVGGDSGPGYPDQVELSWEEVGQVPELTTVTGRERRVFTWSQMQIEEAILACQPDHIFLNFCNYAPDQLDLFISKIATAGSRVDASPVVMYTGWGPTVNDIRVRQLDPCDMTRVELARGNG